MYKNILLPYDFNNTFDNVPKELAKLAGDSGDSLITIFNVVTDNEMSGDVRFNGKHFSSFTKEKIEQLKPFTNKLDELGLNYEVQFEAGRVVPEILQKMKDNDYDIVVMSNKRAKRELQHVIGDVTQKIARRVNIPVLIIK